jgi:regulator of sigma E protease
MTTLAAFLLTLGVLILVHEWGHYRVAVACGVKVLRFSIGFGRPLWRRQRGETEFVLGLLPLGGYVKMLDGREDPVAPADRGRAFDAKPLWQRAAIVAAGPAANLVLAVVLYAGAQWVGMDEPVSALSAPPVGSLAATAGLQATDRVQAVRREGDEAWSGLQAFSELRWQVTTATLDGVDLELRVTDADGRHARTARLNLSSLDGAEVDAAVWRRIGLTAPFSPPVLGDIIEGGAAARAGLRKGDEVLSLNDEAVPDAATLRARIRASGADGVPGTQRWVVLRDGQRLEVAVTPLAAEDRGQRIGRIEAVVGRPPEMVRLRLGPVDGLVRGVERTWEMSVLSLRMMGRMLIGEASLRNLSGPLTIADHAGQSVQLGLAYYLGFLAVVSVSLGVLNLLPLPMLDGGHLMYYLFEAVTGRPVSPAWLDRLQRGGLVVVVLMMSLALYNDVARLLGLH